LIVALALINKSLASSPPLDSLLTKIQEELSPERAELIFFGVVEMKQSASPESYNTRLGSCT
jgi:hypothetical protein